MLLSETVNQYLNEFLNTVTTSYLNFKILNICSLCNCRMTLGSRGISLGEAGISHRTQCLTSQS